MTKTIPPRVQARPCPDDWGDDELMTIDEAKALIWPSGPMTYGKLRLAIRNGLLPVSPTSRRPFLVTRRGLEVLSECSPCELRPPRKPSATVARIRQEGTQTRDADAMLAARFA